MNPSSSRRSVIVGLVVTFALAILAGAILTVGNLNDAFTYRITVSAVFDQVNGLKSGDNVWFSGLKVGIVRDLAFHGAARVEVTMRIDQKAASYIHSDVQATIGSDGLIGNRIVVLTGGTQAAPELAEGDVLAIGEAISSEALLAMLQESNSNLLAITTDVKAITARLSRGEGSLGQLLQDDELYTSLAGSASTLETAATNARDMTASLSSIAGALNRDGSPARALANDRELYPDLKMTVDQLQQASARASDLMDGLALGARDPDTALGALTQDEAAGADLKMTLSNLNDSSALLSEDLEAIQHNILFRRYFRRQARAAARAEASEEASGARP